MKSSLPTVVEAFAKLEQAGFKRPELPKLMSDLATAYHEHLSDLPDNVILAGATAWVREGSRFWPRVSELRKCCLEARRGMAQVHRSDLAQQYEDWEKHFWRDENDQYVPCPVCGSVLEPTGRIRVIHDLQRHKEAGVHAYFLDPSDYPSLAR